MAPEARYRLSATSRGKDVRLNRGALPLALLIFAALAAGIAIAIIKPGNLGEGDGQVARPQPTQTTVQPSPSLPPPSPTPAATLASPEPTEEPTEEPTPEPTEEPNGNGGNGNGNGGQAEPTLADTGGPVLPWLLGGSLLMAGGAGLWRLRRRPL
ncbi:MAG: hypothetical protein ACRDH9_11230 [Actinomycetota bacterium]